ncbi:hypothetical protein SCALM49S_03057 [Streptomyces californicus]
MGQMGQMGGGYGEQPLYPEPSPPSLADAVRAFTTGSLAAEDFQQIFATSKVYCPARRQPRLPGAAQHAAAGDPDVHHAQGAAAVRGQGVQVLRDHRGRGDRSAARRGTASSSTWRATIAWSSTPRPSSRWSTSRCAGCTGSRSPPRVVGPLFPCTCEGPRRRRCGPFSLCEPLLLCGDRRSCRRGGLAVLRGGTARIGWGVGRCVEAWAGRVGGAGMRGALRDVHCSTKLIAEHSPGGGSHARSDRRQPADPAQGGRSG